MFYIVFCFILSKDFFSLSLDLTLEGVLYRVLFHIEQGFFLSLFRFDFRRGLQMRTALKRAFIYVRV